MERIDELIEVFQIIEQLPGPKEMKEAARSLRPTFRKQVVFYALQNSRQQDVWSKIANELHIPTEPTSAEIPKQTELSAEYVSGWNDALTAATKVMNKEFEDLRKRFEQGGPGSDAMGHKSHVCAFLIAELHKLFKTGLPEKVGRVKVTTFNVTQP